MAVCMQMVFDKRHSEILLGHRVLLSDPANRLD